MSERGVRGGGEVGSSSTTYGSIGYGHQCPVDALSQLAPDEIQHDALRQAAYRHASNVPNELWIARARAVAQGDQIAEKRFAHKAAIGWTASS